MSRTSALPVLAYLFVPVRTVRRLYHRWTTHMPGIEHFRTCFSQIVRCCDSLAKELVSASRNMVSPPAVPHPSKSL
ncbi:MAG: hypothetical protein OJF50_006395 [Nitrospira sp.]|nr:hypothetical protein [Nitrospira sp.]